MSHPIWQQFGIPENVQGIKNPNRACKWCKTVVSGHPKNGISHIKKCDNVPCDLKPEILEACEEFKNRKSSPSVRPSTLDDQQNSICVRTMTESNQSLPTTNNLATRFDGIGPPLIIESQPAGMHRQLTKPTESGPGAALNSRRSAVNVLMIGTGEYTTGFVHDKASTSDKSAGVVALTMLDLKRRGKVQSIGLCGVQGSKFSGIRSHLKRAIDEVYADLHTEEISCYPNDSATDPKAYIHALKDYSPGDVVTIFTPDDTHYDIALAAIQHGLHVLITKPVVKTLEEHHALCAAALQHNVLVAVEVHKRWDPMYADARDKAQALGAFSYLYSYMSQPKHQLDTFKSWAGKSSDISYYLNSHHIDFHEWCVGRTARPVLVSAMASTGVAKEQYDMNCEDTITLTVQWENLSTVDNDKHSQSQSSNPQSSQSLGTAVYTSSWIAPRSDVHSQQRFFYMGHKGEITIDQAHRGYSMADDSAGYRSVNPLFMKYTATDGRFSGQNGYGYRSFEAFVDAAIAVNQAAATVSDFTESLASVHATLRTTAILEAGRRSLDEKVSFSILYADPANPCSPSSISATSLLTATSTSSTK